MERDYTAAEDIRDVLQLLNLINERPCITGKTNAQRGTAIAYREVYAIQKRLKHALEVIGADAVLEVPRYMKTEYPTAKIEAKIVMRLYDRKSMTTSQLASELNVSPSSMLDTLQLMQGLGVIESNNIPENESHLTSWRIKEDSSGIHADDDRNRSL